MKKIRIFLFRVRFYLRWYNSCIYFYSVLRFFRTAYRYLYLLLLANLIGKDNLLEIAAMRINTDWVLFGDHLEIDQETGLFEYESTDEFKRLVQMYK